MKFTCTLITEIPLTSPSFWSLWRQITAMTQGLIVSCVSFRCSLWPPYSLMSLGSLSLEQVGVLQQARQILDAAGLSEIGQTIDGYLGSAAHSEINRLRYAPPLAVPFTSQEILSGVNRLTRKAYVHAIANHPVGSILEFPQTGSRMGEAIAHRFRVDPTQSTFINPKDSIQYSLGDTQGRRSSVTCNLLCDLETKKPVNCLQIKMNCASLTA